MIKFFEDLKVKEIILKAGYITIIARDKKVSTLKELGEVCKMQGIYCRNGHILDTINGKITTIDKKVDFDFRRYLFAKRNLDGLKDYEAFAMFIEYKKYFSECYKIILYWTQNDDVCHYEKTTQMDKIGMGSAENAFQKIKQINVNAKSIRKIALKPNLQDTLNSFVDKESTGEWYKRA